MFVARSPAGTPAAIGFTTSGYTFPRAGAYRVKVIQWSDDGKSSYAETTVTVAANPDVEPGGALDRPGTSKDLVWTCLRDQLGRHYEVRAKGGPLLARLRCN